MRWKTLITCGPAMTKTALIYTVVFLVSITTGEKVSNDVEELNARRTDLLDLWQFLRSFNRLWSRGNLNHYRPFIVRRIGDNKKVSYKRHGNGLEGLEDMVKPLTDMLKPFGVILEPIIAMKKPEKKPETTTDASAFRSATTATTTAATTELPKRRMETSKKRKSKPSPAYRAILAIMDQSINRELLPCNKKCPKSNSPICASNGKDITQFASQCEYLQHVRCCKQFREGWKIRSIGECAKRIQRPFVERQPCPALTKS